MGQIDWTAVVVALIAILGSAGVWTLIDHRQQRKFEKEMHDSEVLKEIRAISVRFDEIDQKIDDLENKLENKMDKDKAELRRVRILRFADEVLMNVRHTKDSFDQMLSDITDYETYCNNHPEFKNNKTVETIKYLEEIYAERMEKKDFAQYKTKEIVQ